MYNVNVHENKRKTRYSTMLDIRTQHIVNDEGKRVAVVLDVAEWERVVAALERLDDLDARCDRRCACKVFVN